MGKCWKQAINEGKIKIFLFFLFLFDLTDNLLKKTIAIVYLNMCISYICIDAYT